MVHNICKRHLTAFSKFHSSKLKILQKIVNYYVKTYVLVCKIHRANSAIYFSNRTESVSLQANPLHLAKKIVQKQLNLHNY